ncbi:MAG: hypothetical protein QNK37_03315 [Acidobacteriota bacterium]|nr:hypothetical protein [Acidobacteriota bacterium]
MFLLIASLCAQTITGNLYSTNGQWPIGCASYESGVLVLPASNKVFIVRDHQVEIIAEFQNIFSAIYHRGTFVVSDENGTHFFDEKLVKNKILDSSFLRLFPGKDLYGLNLPSHDPYPKLFKNLSTGKRIFRKPYHYDDHQAWVSHKGHWNFVYWAGTPELIYVFGPQVDKSNNDRMVPGNYPKLDLPINFPRTRQNQTIRMKSRAFILAQEILANTTPVYFNFAKNLFVIAFEIGIKDPKNEYYIGSKIQILSFSLTGNLLSKYESFGQIVGIDNNNVVILHDSEITESPILKWNTLSGAAREKAHYLLKDFKRRGKRSWTIYIERMGIPDK